MSVREVQLEDGGDRDRANTLTSSLSTATGTSLSRKLTVKEKVQKVRTNIVKGPDWKPPEDDSKLQGWRHDLYNVLALPFVVALIALNWDFVNEPWETFWWTRNYHWQLWGVTMVYFVIDLAWVVLIPNCVKSPGVIWAHHIVTMLYLLIPAFLPEQASYFMGACLFVELNTWFLIMRRFANKENVVPWSEGASVFTSLRIQFVVFMFYVTWIGIRNIIYPILLPLITISYLEYSKEVGYFNGLLPAPFIHLSLNLLNLKWSKDLFCPAKRDPGAAPSRGL